MRELGLPVKLVGVGERPDDLQPFEPAKFVDALVPEAMTDAEFMRRALELAERGRGLTSPNPLVGAVVVRDGRIVGRGRAPARGWAARRGRGAGGRRRGRPRRHALRHAGAVQPPRTYAPCAPAVARAGIVRVVAALRDPNPDVGGGGLGALRQAGIAVEVGVLNAEAERQNRGWLTAMRERRPHVTLKAAATLDGKIADVHGASRWITGEPARRQVHRMRAESDAIIVGITTALRDDPSLTVRLERAVAARAVSRGARHPRPALSRRARDPRGDAGPGPRGGGPGGRAGARGGAAGGGRHRRARARAVTVAST